MSGIGEASSAPRARARAMSVMTLVAPANMPSVKEDESQSETSSGKDVDYIADPEKTDADPEAGETYADLELEADDGACCAHCRFAREPPALGKAESLFEKGNVFEKDFQQVEQSNALFFDRGNVFADDYEKRLSAGSLGKGKGPELYSEKVSPFDEEISPLDKLAMDEHLKKELVLEPVPEPPAPVAAPAKAPEKKARKPFREGDTGYLDGLRGLVMIMVFTQHFADNTWLGTHPKVMETGTAVDILRSKISLVLFFALSGRLNVTSYMRRLGTDSPIQWFTLPEAMFRRTLRLSVLSCVMLLLQKAQCAGGAFYPTMDAQAVLQTDGNLWYPSWCPTTRDPKTLRITDAWTTPGDILTALLRLMTNTDNAEQLRETSMLWSMQPQIWGMLYVLMLMPVVAHMTQSRRFAFYALLVTFLGYTQNLNLPFVIGVIMADLKCTGILKRWQSTSRVTYLATECALAGVFLVFLCYNTIEGTIVRAWAPTTYKHGVVGVDTKAGDFGGQPIIIFRATLLFLWLEMSNTFQWLVGNFMFKLLGRHAFGIYVTQMSAIYLVVPPVAMHYAARDQLYWKGIVNAYLATFAANFAFGWVLNKLVDAPALTFSGWLSRTMRKEGFLAVFTQGWRNTVAAVRGAPARAGAIPGKLRVKWAATKKLGSQIRHWRTPVPIIPPPEHPLAYGLDPAEMHSTLFDADISTDPQAVRTRRLLIAWSYIWPFNAIVIPGMALSWGLLNPWHNYITTDFATFSTLWRLLWLLALPYCLITWIGYMTPDITRTPEAMKKRPVCREQLRHFYIVSVTRGSNEDATRRAHTKLKLLEKYHPAVRVIVLTDEPYAYPDLDNMMTPKNYKSPLGLAKHKAKALDYFRTTMKLSPYDFVLHMDEESTMDAESLRGCFDFVRYTPHHIGQGIIIYNGHRYFKDWRAWCFGIADTIRVGDDLARFSLQGNIVQRPIFGIHGSFLLLNGEAENQVGWDFASLAEDFEFSQAAWQKGFTLGRIHGIVREQSPEGFLDFMKQRRRWYIGICQIKGCYHLPQIAIKLWTAGIFCLVATVLNVIFSLLLEWSGPSPYWIYVLACFCFGAFQWLYIGGLLFQELDYGYEWWQWWQIPAHAIALIFIQPFMAVVEGCAVIWAMSTDPAEIGFQVVKK